jgi:hypothetical protein
MIAPLVYILCALTCWTCAILLMRAYRAQLSHLLLWSALAFVVFGVSNILLCVDFIILPATVDLRPLRNAVTLLGVILLLRGLIWEGTR